MWNAVRMIRKAFKFLGIAMIIGYVAGLVAGAAMALT